MSSRWWPKKSAKKSLISDSSPKKSHTCSKLCSSHRSSKSQASRKEASDDQNSSDDDVTVGTSYLQILHSGQASIDFLKIDKKYREKCSFNWKDCKANCVIQQVTKPLSQSCIGLGTLQLNKKLAGHITIILQALGDNFLITKTCPHSSLWSGFFGCLQEEISSTIWSNLIEYSKHLFQDAIETNWATAKHTHMVLLQDIERWKCTWRNLDKVKKIRIQNTAHIITPKQTSSQQKTSKGNYREKVCQDYNANNCQQSADHVHNGQILKHTCSYCFQEMGEFCQHKVQDSIRRFSNEQKD